MKSLLPVFAVLCASLAAQPMTIDQAVREAVDKNLDLAAARFNITIAEARMITARLRPNPVASIGADHLDLLGTGFDLANGAGPNEYSYRTDFVLERGGKRAARMQLAEADRSVASLAFQDTIRKLVFDVQSAFVDVQLAQENLALAEDNLRSLNSIVTVNTARVESGDLAGVELDRSQVAAMQLQTAVRVAELQVRQAKTRLQLLLGRSTLSSEFAVTGPIRRDEAQPDLDELRRWARERRPDLAQVRQAQARNQADLKLQVAQGKVDYTAGAEYRRQQGPSATGNTLGLFLSVPLPVFSRNQGEIARAEREGAQAGALLHAVESRIDGEVASTFQQYSTLRGLLLDIEQKMLEKARKVRQTTEYSYRRGEATLVEFLDAQRAFNDVMQSYNEARANYARSLYMIDSVTATPRP